MLADPLATEEDKRRHIGLKLACNEMRPEVAARMLAALDAGSLLSYAALLHDATFIDPPRVLYHTAPPFRTGIIAAGGLKMCQPGQGGAWAPYRELCKMLRASQPPGVYVAAEPDVRGIYAHWQTWDVWQVTRGNWPWEHDHVSLGCWSLSVDVPACSVRLYGTYGGRDDGSQA
jgi:hypothetical protein